MATWIHGYMSIWLHGSMAISISGHMLAAIIDVFEVSTKTVIIVRRG